MYFINCKTSINSPVNVLFSENCLLRPLLTVLDFLSVKRRRIQTRDYKWVLSVMGLVKNLINGSNNSEDVNNAPNGACWRVHIILLLMTLLKNLSWLLTSVVNRRATARRNPRLGDCFAWSPECDFLCLGIARGYFFNQPGNL